MKSLFFLFLSCKKLRLYTSTFFILILFSSTASGSYLKKEQLTLTGPKVGLSSKWKGTIKVTKDIPILILAGHADSQGLAGAGTSGEAVDIKNAIPMQENISDELFWNLKMQKAIVRIGKMKGLNIKLYDPINRNILDGNDPRTNWSIGANHSRKGGYVLEIHFDSYGEYGFGSGLIPAISSQLTTIDESLAKSFGRYPMFFRGGLGAPRRGIRILEIAKLEGDLEKSLRNINSRQRTINSIATKIVKAILKGIT